MNLSEIFLTDGTLSPTLMIWLLYIAIIIGTVIYFTVNYQLGKIVSKLIEADASTPETAVTIEEAGIKYGFFTKTCLNSPLNYKDLLVAITADGKFYANMHYSDEKPSFKMLRAITRKRKSRIKAKDTTVQPDTEITTTEQLPPKDPPETAHEEAEAQTSPQLGSEKVKFNTYTAKYYIPKEVYDKAKGIYKPSKTNVFLIIAALICLGVVIYFAGFVADGLIDSFTSIGK